MEVEAGSPSSVRHYLLGRSFLLIELYPQALGYFQQNEEYPSPSLSLRPFLQASYQVRAAVLVRRASGRPRAVIRACLPALVPSPEVAGTRSSSDPEKLLSAVKIKPACFPLHVQTLYPLGPLIP